jgi:hypothetical protein
MILHSGCHTFVFHFIFVPCLLLDIIVYCSFLTAANGSRLVLPQLSWSGKADPGFEFLVHNQLSHRLILASGGHGSVVF